ncbi:hypothetical protein SY27_17445 [Flavobacterium sp. 316]|uniref:DUF2061 domain-containing protein n=1 Tax=Flavobacterium sediminilitoris TaxID=2024526 RepID=A0ABY4HMH8_9FLAO|nr:MULTISPECIES: DUF2061 domain-containing protein [Flavobacterium]KIX19831.1 hypothetical protein SY27_17445 [Flavobacterium sp. 316]UOX34061.1 DUF2061 domain-containing protein [Flavobacterium sediminilitoris]
MLLDLLKFKKQIAINKEVKISAYKTITWRILGTIDTVIISYLMTGNFKIAFSIGGFEVFSKMILYFIHERVWTKWTK